LLIVANKAIVDSGILSKIWNEINSTNIENIEPTKRSLRSITLSMIFDIMLSLYILLHAIPILYILATIIRLESCGPALIRSKHLMNKFGVAPIYSFRIYRYVKSFNGEYALSPILTRVGNYMKRWYLDKLPILFNVLTRQIFLVGISRNQSHYTPYLPFNWNESFAFHKPGIMSLWRIFASADDKDLARSLKCDIYYANHRSIRLDLIIFIRTFALCVFGAY
jgi:lipopolysaccharide/colanic/teichoic acid biosynthesis glycosyltransferase